MFEALRRSFILSIVNINQGPVAHAHLQSSRKNRVFRGLIPFKQNEHHEEQCY